jgi:hypothetical protein
MVLTPAAPNIIGEPAAYVAVAATMPARWAGMRKDDQGVGGGARNVSIAISTHRRCAAIVRPIFGISRCG